MTSQTVEKRTTRLSVSAVCEDPRFQVRVRGTDHSMVTRYATSLKGNPRCMPPILVAQVGTRLLVVDGWHRLAAHRRAGLRWVYAEVVPTSEEGALWMAAQANLTNAKPLSGADLKQAFRMYVKARRYKAEGGGYNTYREIAADFANLKAYTTFRNWMISYAPSVALAMSRGEGDDEVDCPRRNRSDDRVRITAALEALRVAQEQITALGPPRDRPEIMAAIAEATRATGVSDRWTPGDAPPF